MNVDDVKKAVENLPTDPAELDDLAQAITDLYQEIVDAAGENPTDEQVDQIEALADAMTKVKAARSDAEKEGADEAAAVEDRRARAAAAAEAFAADKGDEAEGDAGEFTADDADDAATEDATEDTDAAADEEQQEPDEEATYSDADKGDDTDGDADEDGDEDKTSEKAGTDSDKEMTVNQRRFAGKVKGDQKAATPAETPFSLDATAPNYKAGSVSMFDLAQALEGMTSGRAIRTVGTGARTTAQFGHITRNIADDLTGNDEASLATAISNATDEKRLDGNSLVAAGGWCAPSETIYDFLPTTPATGLLSLPEVGINRGGLRYPVEPDFSALYDASKYHMTEAEAIAGTTKECIEIPCADMAEMRLEVQWTCVTGNLLSNKGWPELTAKFLAEATKGHLHRLSAARLRAVKGFSEAVTPGIPSLGTVGTVLNAVELHAEDLRLKYRLGDATIEGIAPAWLRPVLRADLAYRDKVLPEQVTDQELDAHFAGRGVRFQYVDDYQNDIIGAGATGLKYPEAVEVILYPAGTFFSAVENVINLGVTYDSTGLSRNQRTELFVEDGYGVGKRAYESRALTIPVNVNGHTGLRAEVVAAAGGAEGN